MQWTTEQISKVAGRWRKEQTEKQKDRQTCTNKQEACGKSHIDLNTRKWLELLWAIYFAHCISFFNQNRKKSRRSQKHISVPNLQAKWLVDRNNIKRWLSQGDFVVYKKPRSECIYFLFNRFYPFLEKSNHHKSIMKCVYKARVHAIIQTVCEAVWEFFN